MDKKKKKRAKVKPDTSLAGNGNRALSPEFTPSVTDKKDVPNDEIIGAFDIIPDFRGGNFV